MTDQTVQQRPRMLDRFTLRMLGENVTFTRSQWIELTDELRPDGDLHRRIEDLIAGAPDAPVIDDAEAKRLANSHGGHWQELADTGAISAPMAESARRLAGPPSATNQLVRYAAHHGPRGPVEGWSA